MFSSIKPITNIIFWFALDISLVALSIAAIYFGSQVWYAPALACAIVLLSCALLSSLVKLQHIVKYHRLLICLQISVGIGLFTASGAGVLYILPETSISENGSLILLIGGLISSGVFGLLAHVWSTKVQLASLYRLGFWFGLPLVIMSSLQAFPIFGLDINDNDVAVVIFALGLILALDMSVQRIKNLVMSWRQPMNTQQIFGVLLLFFFSRQTPLISFFETLNERFGVDFRSSWAITVLRRALEPILVGTVLLGWVSTAFVTVDTHQSAVVERLGEPQQEVRSSGLQIVFPWPIDRVRLVDTERIQTMSIGHEKEEVSALEEEEEESILWANQHADEEYTLLLGDGRDLISADGVLHYQIVDPIAFYYGEQNPTELLRAIAYRALMHETAYRTLDEALSENLIQLAKAVTARIQTDAAELVPCLKPVSFSFRALHPPVAVAEAYQSVVSAQIDRQTRIIRAEAYRRARIPSAKAEKNTMQRSAEGDAIMRIAEAKGEAYAFEGLYGTVYADLELYRFRKAQESLEQQLKGKKMFIVDHRIERDGGTLWIQE